MISRPAGAEGGVPSGFKWPLFDVPYSLSRKSSMRV